MAYCKNCGAYIPDNQTRCLACGKTEEEIDRERKAAAGASTASAAQQAPSGEYHYTSEKMKEELKKQRAKQQEYDRKWAENEKARREREKQAAEKKKEEQSERQPERSKQPAAETKRIFAVLSYLWIGCFIPMIVCPGDEFCMFHAKQGLRLLIVGAIASALANLIGIGWLVTVGWLYLMYVGMKNALNGLKKPLPFIGK